MAKLRMDLRSSGIWSLLWGLFAIVTGLATLAALRAQHVEWKANL